MFRLCRRLTEVELTQPEAARLLGVSQPLQHWYADQAARDGEWRCVSPFAPNQVRQNMAMHLPAGYAVHSDGQDVDMPLSRL